MEKVIAFTPFSEMREVPFHTRVQGYRDLRIDEGDREIQLAQASRVHAQEHSAPLAYTAKESVEWRRTAAHCEICETPLSDMRSKQGDHDHKTGKWRGVLCASCNWRVGWYEFLKDRPEFVQKIETYLNRNT